MAKQMFLVIGRDEDEPSRQIYARSHEEAIKIARREERDFRPVVAFTAEQLIGRARCLDYATSARSEYRNLQAARLSVQRTSRERREWQRDERGYKRLEHAQLLHREVVHGCPTCVLETVATHLAYVEVHGRWDDIEDEGDELVRFRAPSWRSEREDFHSDG